MIELDKLLFGGFIDRERNAVAEALYARLEKKYGEPEVGTTRAVFFSKKHVVKVPINDKGEYVNDYEGSVSSDIYARGRWVEIEGFICVIQERLDLSCLKNFSYKNFPDWVGNIDCGQVGHDRKGNLKAFDFG